MFKKPAKALQEAVPQRTLYGLTGRQILRKIREVETIGGWKKRVFVLHTSGNAVADFDVLSETETELCAQSGLCFFRIKI